MQHRQWDRTISSRSCSKRKWELDQAEEVCGEASSLRHVVVLTGAEREGDRQAERIDYGMELAQPGTGGSDHQGSAIHMQGLAGNISCSGSSQHTHCRRDLFG